MHESKGVQLRWVTLLADAAPAFAMFPSAFSMVVHRFSESKAATCPGVVSPQSRHFLRTKRHLLLRRCCPRREAALSNAVSGLWSVVKAVSKISHAHDAVAKARLVNKQSRTLSGPLWYGRKVEASPP